jgi:DNA-binding PadR family transcriptional regulator
MIRSFFLGFIRLHLLYHASKKAVFGLEMIRELEHHGYQLSPGTLYPILHNLEKEGYLISEKQVFNGKVRKYYQATDSGKEALKEASKKVIELMQEINIHKID